jgi:hypothetical protein
MCLAILLDAEGERSHPPILGLADLSAEACDDRLELLGQLVDLGVGCVLTRQEHMLVHWHGGLSLSSFIRRGTSGAEPLSSLDKMKGSKDRFLERAETREDGIHALS